jgi:hypothetical protein
MIDAAAITANSLPINFDERMVYSNKKMNYRSLIKTAPQRNLLPTAKYFRARITRKEIHRCASRAHAGSTRNVLDQKPAYGESIPLGAITPIA